METCVRGFSFMSDKVNAMDLQYIEGGELERTWKITRRERHKQREDKIWENFVKEKDIVNSVCEDDQYQFLEHLPEKCLKEIMDSELEKLKHEVALEEAKAAVNHFPPEQVRSSPILTQGHSSNSDEDNQHTCVVTFAKDIDKDDSDQMFHIYDDERDIQSEPEDGVLNDSTNSLPTVRERQSEVVEVGSLERPSSGNNTSSTGKSSENVTNVIESSIYCAKVKELRNKIDDEIINMMTSLDRRDVFSMEQEDMSRMIKRSAEFCTRFNRIYMYQLHRQMHDIKRNNTLTLPFAKHTKFQAQMVRIVSLHQNLLQSFQVFRRSVDQTWCVRESVSALGALVGAVRAATAHCASVKQPKDLVVAQDLYNDNLLQSCDKLEAFVNEYTIRCEEFLNSFANVEDRPAKKSPKSPKIKTKKRLVVPNVRNSAQKISESDARLSMYSLETLRLNNKSSSSKDIPSNSATKNQSASNNANNTGKKGQANKNDPPPMSQRKSPKSHRPLMRDPHAGRPRPPKVPRIRDNEIRTMVEGVGPCPSPCPPSRSASPQRSPTRRCPTTRTPRVPRPARSPCAPLSPRSPRAAPKEPGAPRKVATNNTRRTRAQNCKTPRKLSPRLGATAPDLNITLNCAQNVVEEHDPTQMTPVRKIQCARKQPTQEKVTEAKYNVEEEGSKILRKPLSPKVAQAMKISKSLDVEEETENRSEVKSPDDRYDMSRILKQLCSGDASGSRTERTSGAKNVQLLCVTGSSPRNQPTTPQLLRILEETIQKKVPKLPFHKTRDVEKYRLTFNIAESVTDNLFQYRTKFVQHMLTSPMYANSTVGKPWELIGSVSEQIIDDVLLNCVKEMELREVIQELYKRETKF